MYQVLCNTGVVTKIGVFPLLILSLVLKQLKA